MVLIHLLLMFIYSILSFINSQACSNYFMLFPPPDDLGYRFFLVAVVVFNLLLSLFTETVLSDKLVRKATTKKDKAYELVNKELRKQPQWPPLSPLTEGSSSSSTDQSSSKDSQVAVIQNSLSYVNMYDLGKIVYLQGDCDGNRPSAIFRAGFQQPLQHSQLFDTFCSCCVAQPIHRHAAEAVKSTRWSRS